MGRFHSCLPIGVVVPIHKTPLIASIASSPFIQCQSDHSDSARVHAVYFKSRIQLCWASRLSTSSNGASQLHVAEIFSGKLWPLDCIKRLLRGFRCSLSSYMASLSEVSWPKVSRRSRMVRDILRLLSIREVFQPDRQTAQDLW